MVKVKVSRSTGQYFEGWKRFGFLATIVTVLGLAMYPIAVDPVMNIDKYSKNNLIYTHLCNYRLLI